MKTVTKSTSETVMIRNLFVIDGEGNSLVVVNFGECHSLGENDKVVSGFISAIQSFSKMVSGEGANEIRLGNLFFIMSNHDDLLFALASDTNKDDENKRKLKRIMSLFIERYADYLQNRSTSMDYTIFDEFGSLLVTSGIAERNCGENPDCEECENRHKTLPLDELTEQLG